MSDVLKSWQKTHTISVSFKVTQSLVFLTRVVPRCTKIYFNIFIETPVSQIARKCYVQKLVTLVSHLGPSPHYLPPPTPLTAVTPLFSFEHGLDLDSAIVINKPVSLNSLIMMFQYDCLKTKF